MITFNDVGEVDPPNDAYLLKSIILAFILVFTWQFYTYFTESFGGSLELRNSMRFGCTRDSSFLSFNPRIESWLEKSPSISRMQ